MLHEDLEEDAEVFAGTLSGDFCHGVGLRFKPGQGQRCSGDECLAQGIVRV
jgi:hypothetical protein